VWESRTLGQILVPWHTLGRPLPSRRNVMGSCPGSLCVRPGNLSSAVVFIQSKIMSVCSGTSTSYWFPFRSVDFGLRITRLPWIPSNFCRPGNISATEIFYALFARPAYGRSCLSLCISSCLNSRTLNKFLRKLVLTLCQMGSLEVRAYNFLHLVMMSWWTHKFMKGEWHYRGLI
jgi:hypothetical protein